MSPPRPAVVWDPRFREYDFGPGHPFTEASRDLAVRLLRASLGPPGIGRFLWVDRLDSAEGLLRRFHGPEYIEYVRQASDRGDRAYLDLGDTPSFAGCFGAATSLVAGADRAVHHALDTGTAAFHPGGGLHHAGRSGASGFCVFNDVAVAIADPVANGRRVAYIDIDAHHGDGVMYGFYDSGRVLDIDFHQDGRTLFPGTGFPPETGRGDGAGSKVNVPLPPGAGDEAVLPLFRRLVPPLLDGFRPDLIVLQHGVDGHAGDPLTRLQYTPSAYVEVLRTVVRLANAHCAGRLVVVGGGGYRPETVSRVLARAGRILGGVPLPDDGESLPEGWRSEYAAETGVEAPARWATPLRLVRSPWREQDEARLVRELEDALGRKFPASPPEPPRPR